MAGRPRGIDDSVILRATAEVIGRVGPAGLTLGAVAEEVGLVPGTLVQRFGSKHGLLVALARQSAQDADELHRRSAEGHPFPLAALTALLVTSMAPLGTPESFANHLAFLCMDLTDPQLHEHALAIHRSRGTAVRALLIQAVGEGELRAGTDTAALTGTIQAITAGAGLTWALDRRGTLPQRLREAVDAVLLPHRPSRSDASTDTEDS
ncbi:TetR/AcrR family transcriptional regulator [Peterkaempfera sp. SMS 1(5)a]|uniref:TetR/AcrR family transcriptional regulator n=1 Tax=Peterkaempfera podocarpi TaxID=3232308 RepID=UPI00367011B2